MKTKFICVALLLAAAAGVAMGQDGKRYGIKSGILTQKSEMGETTVYFDNYGAVEAQKMKMDFMGNAMEILQEGGFDAIRDHEQKLISRLIDGLKKIDNVVIYGDSEDISDRVGVVTFNFTDINSYFLASQLSGYGAATRRGAFCAHPYVWRLMGIPNEDLDDFADCGDSGTPGMIRVSFGIYNTPEEVDEFLEMLARAIPAAKETVAKMIEEVGESRQAFEPLY